MRFLSFIKPQEEELKNRKLAMGWIESLRERLAQSVFYFIERLFLVQSSG